MNVCHSFFSAIMFRPCIKATLYHRYINAYNGEIQTENIPFLHSNPVGNAMFTLICRSFARNNVFEKAVIVVTDFRFFRDKYSLKNALQVRCYKWTPFFCFFFFFKCCLTQERF